MAQSGVIQTPTPYSFRNLMVNPTFQFGQRGSVFNFNNVTTNALIMDNWRYLHGMPSGTFPTVSASIQYSTTRLAGVPGTAHYYGRFTISNQGSANVIPAGAAYSCLKATIENVLTFEDRMVYLSFYARSTIPNKIIAAEIGQFDGTNYTRNGSKAFTLSSVWKRYSVPVKLPAINTTLTVGHGINIVFWFMSGTDASFVARHGVAGGFAFGGTGDIEITNIQFEGDSLSPFEFKTNAEEYARCLRYLYNVSGFPIGLVSTGFWTTQARIEFPVPMRTSPTLVAPSFSMTAGSAGTPTVYSVNNFWTLIYNSANNWTPGAVGFFAGQFTAELS